MAIISSSFNVIHGNIRLYWRRWLETSPNLPSGEENEDETPPNLPSGEENEDETPPDLPSGEENEDETPPDLPSGEENLLPFILI